MRSVALILALPALLLPACHRAGDPSGPLVAHGKGVAVATRDLQARIDEMPPAARARYASPEARKELLESLVLLELQAAEAERAGLGGGPDFREGGKRRMVQRLVQQRFHDPDSPRTIPDAEVRDYYESHLEDYVQPVKMRLAHITLEAPQGSPGRAARLVEARKLQARLLRESGSDPAAFETAIVSVVREGNPENQAAVLGLLSQAQLALAFTPTIAEAAWALPPGRPSEVLASPRGFHILQGSGGQPAMAVSLAQARGGIQVILYQARMAQAYREWVGKLLDQSQTVIDQGELARIRVEPEGPALTRPITPAGPAGR